MPFDKVVFHRCFDLPKCTLLTSEWGDLCYHTFPVGQTWKHFQRILRWTQRGHSWAGGTREEYRGEQRHSGSSSKLRETDGAAG